MTVHRFDGEAVCVRCARCNDPACCDQTRCPEPVRQDTGIRLPLTAEMIADARWVQARERKARHDLIVAWRGTEETP